MTDPVDPADSPAPSEAPVTSGDGPGSSGRSNADGPWPVDQVAALAERRLWATLLKVDGDFCGMSPSQVRDHAQARHDHLSDRVAHLDDGLLEALSPEDRDHAFTLAAARMHSHVLLMREAVDRFAAISEEAP